MDGRINARPEPQPFKIGDPIPRTGDGENHPDVRHMRRALSDPGLAKLALAHDYPGAAAYMGGEPWTAERIKAAVIYILARGVRV